MYTKLVTAPAGLTVTFPGDGAAVPVVAFLFDAKHPVVGGDDIVRVLAVRNGALAVAPLDATVAAA